jgi:hypothetical protein
MTIEVPAEELVGVASTLGKHAVLEAADAETAARTADRETDGPVEPLEGVTMTLDVGAPVPSEGDESRAALPVRVVAAR